MKIEQSGRTPEEQKPYLLIKEAFFSGLEKEQLSDIQKLSTSVVLDFMSTGYIAYKKTVADDAYSLDPELRGRVGGVSLKYLDGFTAAVVGESEVRLPERVVERLRLFETAFVHLLKEDDSTGELSVFLKENPLFREAIGGRPDWLAGED